MSAWPHFLNDRADEALAVRGDQDIGVREQRRQNDGGQNQSTGDEARETGTVKSGVHGSG